MSDNKFLRRLAHRDGPLLVIDLEATCSRDGSVPKKAMEVIEIGAVAVDTQCRPFDSFQAFVRPRRHPRLTAFCQELTTISQPDVDAAETLPEVMASFGAWIAGKGATLWGSWGMFDRVLFDREFKQQGLVSPLPPVHVNLRECFEATVSATASDFGAALDRVGLRFRGQQHRGIDDAENIARLLPSIQAQITADGG